MAATLSLSLFLQIDYGRYFIRIPLRRSSRAVRTSSKQCKLPCALDQNDPFEVAFLELVKLIIVSSHRYPIQVLVVMPLNNLELSDSDDSMLRIHIASRLPFDSKTVEPDVYAHNGIFPRGHACRSLLVLESTLS
nr:hypothetical protein [Tanacetum cinerariifolium]